MKRWALYLGAALHLTLVQSWAMAQDRAESGTEDRPQFRAGEWTFSRTIWAEPGGAPAVTQISECIDPTEIFSGRSKLRVCNYSPMAHDTDTDTYTFSVECEIPGATIRSNTTLVVQSDSAYRLNVETTSAGTKSFEQVIATRVSACK